MKNKKIILTAIIASGLCFSVGAATGVKISAELKKQPMKVNGTSVTKEVISYNNTTYVPLRQAGEMLGATVNYTDGVVVLDSASGWALMGSEEEPFYVNTQLNALLYISENVDDGVPLKEWLDEVENTETVKINSKSMEKVGDLDVAYMNTEVDGVKQVEGYVVYDGICRTYIMNYADNADAESLKQELLQAIAEDF